MASPLDFLAAGPKLIWAKAKVQYCIQSKMFLRLELHPQKNFKLLMANFE